ncbi:MAG: molybdate ABC transporter substrate-binding protein [Desulfopila sp.]
MHTSLFLALFWALALTLSPVGASAGQSLTVAAGAGYKQLVDELSTVFSQNTGIEVERIYGNMGQVTAQASQSGVVDVVIGDKRFLDGSTLEFANEYPIGAGKLMVAVSKGSEARSLGDLASAAVTRIAMPDAKKAIYGRAASQYLENSGMMEKIREKLLVVGTVPQVSAYVVSGEVDMGFINLTDALAIADKVARIIPVDEALYQPVLIVGKRLKGGPDTEEADAFGLFLASPEVKNITARHGL